MAGPIVDGRTRYGWDEMTNSGGSGAPGGLLSFKRWRKVFPTLASIRRDAQAYLRGADSHVAVGPDSQVDDGRQGGRGTLGGGCRTLGITILELMSSQFCDFTDSRFTDGC